MWLVVGLGNPGAKHARNRHNIGFRVVEELARRATLPAWKSDKTTGLVAGQKCALLKPMDFMNRSGFAVRRAMDFHDVDAAHVVIIHDELDLDFGIVRLKQGGGHGGHNGLRSIMEQLGNGDFLRVRMGIGRDPNKPPGSKDAATWVLSDFPSAVADQLTAVISAGCEATEGIVELGMYAAMNKYNGRPAVL